MPAAAEPSLSVLLAARTLLAALRRCRVIVGVLVLLVLGLNAAPQATDLLITLGQSGSSAAWLGLGIGAAWLAVNAWFWSRFVLAATELSLDAPARLQPWVAAWLPRLLASGALATVALGLWHAARQIPPSVLRQMGMVGSGVGRLEAAAVLALIAAMAALAHRGREAPAGTTLRAHGSAAWWMMALSAGVAAASMAAYGAAPVLTARVLPPATTVLFAAAGLMCGGTLLLHAGMRTRVPILFLVFVAAALLAVLRDRDVIADNHDIRRFPGTPRQRFDLGEAFERFLAATGPAFGTAPIPVVLVAASGGGIAASYWTAAVLGDLADASPAFASQVFAISGVSGGALGALEFAAARTGPPGCSDPSSPQPNPPRTTEFRQCLQLALGEDFLGPALGVLLYPDLMQRFLPVPVFADRAAALELAWEARWRAVFGDDRLKHPFLDLWEPGRPWPALFLNGTSLVTGGRLITSNLALWPPGAPAARPGIAGPGADLLATLGAEIPASTAASNSARFPYISPLGTVRRAGASGRATDAVADGGYFESLGATTLLDVLDLLDGLAKRDGRHVRFVVLQIVNDPSVRPDESGSAAAMDQAATLLLPLGLTGPATILLRTRAARGLNASETLARRVLALGGIYIPVRLGQSPTGAAAPLGWSLSRAARDIIDGQWTQACRDRLLADAGFAGEAPPGPEIVAGNPMQMHIAAMWDGAACGAVVPDARPRPAPPSRP
jgi:hypothetical protein